MNKFKQIREFRAITYPTPKEKLAHLVRLTADKLSETKDKKKQQILVNQLQHYRELWERSSDENI